MGEPNAAGGEGEYTNERGREPAEGDGDDLTFSRRSTLGLVAGAVGAVSGAFGSTEGQAKTGESSIGSDIEGFGYGGVPIRAGETNGRRAAVAATATAAVSGSPVEGRGNVAASSGTHTLRVDGSGSTSRYEFAVTGEVLGGGDDWDDVSGSRVSGAVRGWRDEYEFTGSLDTVSVNGDATVLLDGEEIDPDDYAGGNRTITFEGSGSTSRYEFAVTGEVLGGGDDWDDVSGSGASGAVRGWRDEYEFAGSLDTVSVNGDATVLLDGEEIDPDAYGAPAGGEGDSGEADGTPTSTPTSAPPASGSGDDVYGTIGYGEGGYGGVLSGSA